MLRHHADMLPFCYIGCIFLAYLAVRTEILQNIQKYITKIYLISIDKGFSLFLSSMTTISCSLFKKYSFSIDILFSRCYITDVSLIGIGI